MKHSFRKFVLVTILLISSIGMLWNNSPTAKAQGLGTSTDNTQNLFCARDFSNFLATGLDLDGEGFIDYWLDILDIPGYRWSRYSSNYCRYMDIDSLLNRIDKSRKRLRQAFYACDKVTSLKIADEYNQMSAELWYLRHFVDTDNPPKKNGSKQEQDQTVKKRPTADLRDEFKARFIDKGKYFNLENGLQFFDKLEKKYQSKIEEYKKCTDPNIGMLKQKLQDISDTIDQIVQMGKKFAERTANVYEKTKNKVLTEKGILGGLFSANNFSDYMQNLVNFRVNNEDGYSKTPWEQISGGFMQNAPTEMGSQLLQSGKNTFTKGDLTNTFSPNQTAGTSNPTVLSFNSVYGDLQTISQKTESQNLDMEYLAELEIKYRLSNGVGLRILMDKLIELMNIIDTTSKPLGEVEKCVSRVVEKQCGK